MHDIPGLGLGASGIRRVFQEPPSGWETVGAIILGFGGLDFSGKLSGQVTAGGTGLPPPCFP